MSSRTGSPGLPVCRVPVAPDGTEARILEAAELCLARLGLARLSLTDVAAQAGVSRGAVYLHFADRRALIDAVLTRAAGGSSPAAPRPSAAIARWWTRWPKRRSSSGSIRTTRC